MKREHHGHGGYSVMKKGHEEKHLKNISVADTKYGKNNMDNEVELHESVNKLSGYVKSHRMKY